MLEKLKVLLPKEENYIEVNIVDRIVTLTPLFLPRHSESAQPCTSSEVKTRQALQSGL